MKRGNKIKSTVHDLDNNSLSKPIKQWSITDTEVYLSYLICIGWIKGLYTNIVMIQRS